MDHLIAKVRQRGKQKYCKLVSEQQIYEIRIEDPIDYSPATLIEEEQWYRIQKFSKKDYCIDLLKKTWDSTKYEQINAIEIEKIEYICAYQAQNDYCFQRVYKSNIIKNKWILHFGEDVELSENKSIITINEQPDAIYKKDQDCLYFRKLNAITAIFHGIDAIYREATREEVDEFLSEPFIDLDYGYTADNVGVANRRRIALAMETLKGMNQKQRKDIFQYTNEYYPGLQYDGKKFKISKEDDLKTLLYGIEQRYYTTPITNERRCANSVTKI